MEVSRLESRRGSSKSESGVSISESKLGSYLSYSQSGSKKPGENSQSIGNEVREIKIEEMGDKEEVMHTKEEEKPQSPTAIKLRYLIDHWTTQVFMTTLTFYILFADDFKMILTDITADNAFSSVCVGIMFIFTVEFIISAFVVKDYFLGFYFWLDFVSLLSMLLDVHWFYDAIINSMTGATSIDDTSGNVTGSSNIKSIGAIAKLGRAAKVGSRAIRILRILRIIRLVRISKLYKASEKLIEERVNKEMKKLKEKPKNQVTTQKTLKIVKEEVRKSNLTNPGIRNSNASKLGANDNGKETPVINKVDNLDRNLLIDYEKVGNNQNLDANVNPDNAVENNQVKPEETPEELEAPQEQIPQESKVGNKLTDLTTRRVIILVLSMMMGIILFNPTFYYTTLTSMDFGLQIFPQFDSIHDPNFNLSFNIYVNEHLNISSPIIFAQVGYLSFGDLNDTYLLRDAEKTISGHDCTGLIPDDEDFSVCTAIFNNKSGSQLSSILNMMKTIFICIVLTGGAVCFSKDTSEMVLQPIESMIQKIKEISKNPLEAMQNNEKEEFAKALLEEEEKEKAGCNIFCGGGEAAKKENDKKETPLETAVLENTITKIGALLALGFGEAGSEIIAQNMQNNANGDVNPMLPGKKVMSIYGFCDIRNFTDTTEVLQEKVMIFVNEIAEIVHEITAEHCGSANKNIGDAFLLIWKFEEQFTKYEEDIGELVLIQSKSVSQICDMALISFIKILAKVHKSYKLDKYRKNKGLNDRIKNYCVKMGFGLHLGWSIEGAIGSTFKIDASYLSPHVNTASHLEEKTKEYGVQLVISGEFMKYCSEEARKASRIIDETVSENGHKETVYTIDIDINALKIEEVDSDAEDIPESNLKGDNVIQIKSKENNGVSQKKLQKFKKRMKRKMNYEDAINCVKNVWKEFEEGDEDFQIMRRKFKPEFYDCYKEGFELFRNGDWHMAKEAFESAQEFLGDKDGPTENLLRIMKTENFIKPESTHNNVNQSQIHSPIQLQNQINIHTTSELKHLTAGNENHTEQHHNAEHHIIDNHNIEQAPEPEPFDSHENHPDGWLVKRI